MKKSVSMDMIFGLSYPQATTSVPDLDIHGVYPTFPDLNMHRVYCVFWILASVYTIVPDLGFYMVA